MLESKYQADLILRIKDMFPGCIIQKTDANYIQGFPDLLILFNKKWACLEVKQSSGAPLRPNQKWYIDRLDLMGYAKIIYPEIEAEVLSSLSRYFHSEETLPCSL